MNVALIGAAGVGGWGGNEGREGGEEGQVMTEAEMVVTPPLTKE